MAVFEDAYASSDAPPHANAYGQVITTYVGALCSLALIAGLCVWGYQLIMRDVTGLPVVRAIEGDMRVLPGNPGGGLALHTGLAVNEVAASGAAGAPEDRLVLAPSTTGFAEADLVATPQADAVAQTIMASLPDDPAQEIVADAQIENSVDALADQLAALAPEPALAPEDPAAARIPANVPGLSQSMRPVARGTTGAASPEVAVATTTLPAGTNLVQLGSFPSPALAAQDWDRLTARFGPLLEGHDHLIQVSSQTSGTWYRLRAIGFSDRAAARRLCAALQAEGAECIAVVTN